MLVMSLDSGIIPTENATMLMPLDQGMNLLEC